MTRFARAKGSKASNEKVPEEATSWQEMKQQLEEKKQQAEIDKKRKIAERTRKENYENFLNELEENDEKKESWAEVEAKVKVGHKKKVKVKAEVDREFVDLVGKIDKVIETEKEEEASAEQRTKAGKIKKEKKKNGSNIVKSKDVSKDSKNVDKNQQNGKQKQSKQNQKPNSKVKKPYDELTEEEKKRINKKKEKRARQAEKRKEMKAEKAKLTEPHENDNSLNKSPGEAHKRKLHKDRVNKEHKRRKPNDQQNTMNINGVEVKISFVDGFPIKSEDAARLHKLRKQMISKGIPRSEIQAAMKLERRRAEKALAREKKKVCFNCRKSGHVLSECPELSKTANQEMIGSDICFKCGSTEHTHFECKVVRTDNYKFATCFICKEQGHISRQCPDNSRGLYPKGGACKVCGDVTHLKKDCPKYQAQQEALNVQVDSIKFDGVESLDNTVNENAVRSRPNKVVKF